MIWNILVTVITFFFMEFVAWFAHKYVMHGFLWFLHEDHHAVDGSFFEKNDWFFVIFAVPSMICYITGIIGDLDYKLYIGIGISIYGLCYFIVHDIIIHQRFKLWTHSKNRYILAIRRAHKMHHKHIQKEHGENFGMLIVPFKYWKNPNTSK
jgi:beta-carotene 3-hydroxylase